MIPISRVEMYLAKICGEDVELPIPQTRKEVFLAIIAGESYEKPVPSSRVELYLAKILGDDVPIPIPQSREEIFLAAIAGVEYPLPYPESRIEYWLHKWATYEEWETISGNPVSFTAKAAPLRQLSVVFSPKQDLHGYDSPWPAGGGVNLFDISTAITNGPISSYGITEISIDSNGKVHIIGTSASSVSSFSIGVIKAGDANAQQLMGKGYTLSTWDVTGGTIYSCWGFRTDTENAFAISMANPGNGVSFDLSFKPMVSNGAATAWTPYSNICPILGWDSLNVEQRGKNLFNPSNVLQNTNINPNGTITNNNGYTSVYVQISNGQKYTLSQTVTGAYVRYTLADSLDFGSAIYSPTNNAHTYVSSRPLTFTNNHNHKYLVMLVHYSSDTVTLADVLGSIQLELGDEATDYVPYNPSSRSISISLGSTVYSGTVDVVTGVGEITQFMVEFDGTEDWSTNGIGQYKYWYNNSRFAGISAVLNSCLCSHGKQVSISVQNPYLGVNINNVGGNLGFLIRYPDAYGETSQEFTAWVAEQKTSGTPLQAVGTFATPITIQLTPQEVESLAGDNTMWTDGDSLTVEYRSN